MTVERWSALQSIKSIHHLQIRWRRSPGAYPAYPTTSSWTSYPGFHTGHFAASSACLDHGTTCVRPRPPQEVAADPVRLLLLLQRQQSRLPKLIGQRSASGWSIADVLSGIWLPNVCAVLQQPSSLENLQTLFIWSRLRCVQSSYSSVDCASSYNSVPAMAHCSFGFWPGRALLLLCFCVRDTVPSIRVGDLLIANRTLGF